VLGVDANVPLNVNVNFVRTLTQRTTQFLQTDLVCAVSSTFRRHFQYLKRFSS